MTMLDRHCYFLISLLFFISVVEVAFSQSNAANETSLIQTFDSGENVSSSGNQSFEKDGANFTTEDVDHEPDESFHTTITSEIQTDERDLETNRTDETSPTTNSDDVSAASETKPPAVTTTVISRTSVITVQDALCLDLRCDCPDPNVENGGIFLDCSGRRIRTLPDKIVLPATLSGITFQKNDISVINRGAFSARAPNIEELDFAENSIDEIDDDAFEFFESLVKLRLSHNRLRKLSAGLLHGLANLRVLEIDNNAITELSASLFSTARNLQEIRMQRNKLSVLGADTFKFLDKLAKLDLSENGIQALHADTFEPTPLLNWLSLTDNSLLDVPRAALSKAKKLHSLDLSGNRFAVLQEGTFASLDGVSCLYLNNIETLTRIKELAFANMSTLKTLHINFNKKLSYLHPNAFGSKSSVEQLSLSENALQTLPEPSSQDVGIWSRLSHADLSKNPWVCDCNLRWMKRAPQEIFSAIKCESPLNMHGRSFAKVQEAELECYDSWMISSVILGLSCVLVFSVCSGLFFAMIYSRSSIKRYIKARSQFMYAKVPPSKIESVDLEWDPSADA